jgi:hypothetical protein
MNTENELFGELHEQEENGLFGNEHRRQYEAHQEALRQPPVVGRSEQLDCGNKNPPCARNLKFGMLECCNCNWSE